MIRNVGSTWVMTLVTIAAIAVCSCLSSIHRLGEEGYGTWTLITAMTGYMNLMALGVPMACVRYLAQHVAEGDQRKMNETIGSCAGLYLMLGAATALVGVALTFVFVFLFAHDIPAVWRTEAPLAFGLMVLQVSAGFIGLLPEGIMFAHHDFVVRNLVRIGGVILETRPDHRTAAHRRVARRVVLAVVQLVCLPAVDFGVSLLLIRRRYPKCSG